MTERRSRSYVGSEGRLGTPLLDEIFERANELTDTKQRELVDELFQKAAEVGVARSTKTARARKALDRLEKITARTSSEKPARRLADSRAAEADASEVPHVMGFSDRTPAQGIVALGATYQPAARPRPPQPPRAKAKAQPQAATPKAPTPKAPSASRAKRASADSRISSASSARSSKASARSNASSARSSKASARSESRRRRARSSREARLEPISELPPLPNLPQSLPPLELDDDYGFGFSGMDEDHLAELDRLVANTTHGWAPQAPRPPRRGLVRVGSESDDELAIV
ncbi:MAG: hypothetical protein KDD82_26810 [Planctomycetes bacterium]|nr:hypothetical protein [Planctomycetota bacterium]